jgi:hypothetical protein
VSCGTYRREGCAAEFGPIRILGESRGAASAVTADADIVDQTNVE